MEMEERIDETFDKMNGTPGAMKDAIVLEKISADIDKDDVKLDKPDIPTTVIDEKIKSIELPKVDATNVPLKDDETPTALQNSDSMKSKGIFVESAPKHPEDTPLESKTLKSEETKPANTSQIGEDVDSVPSTPTNTVTLDGEAIKKVLNVDEVCETEKETANTDVVCESVEDVVNSNALSETVNQKTIAGNIGKDDDEENASIIADSSPIKGSDITIISATSEDDVSDGMEVDPTEDESEVNESKEDADIIEDESEPEDDYDSENVSETHDMSEDDNDEDDEEDYDDMDVKEDFVSSGAKKMYRAPRSLLIKLRNRSIVWLNKSQAKKADRMHAMDVAHPTTAADTYTTILPIQSTFKPSTTNEFQENAKPIDVLEQSSPVGNIPSTSDSIAIGAAAAALFPDGVVSENVIGLAAVLQSTQNAVAAIISNAPTTNGNQVDDNKDNSDDVMEISMDVSDDTVTNNNEQIEFTEGSVAPPEVSNVVPIVEADIVEIIEATPEPKDPEKTVSSKRKAQTLSPTLEEKSEKKVKIAEVKIVNNVEMTFNEENAKNEVERQPQDILEKEAAVEENEAKKIEEKQEETKGEKKENEKIVTTEVNIVPTTNKAEEVKDLKSNLHDDVQAPAPTSLSSKKRPRSPSSNGIESPQISNIEDTEEVPPTKKLCAELQSNFANFHERLLTEYIETTPNNTMDDIQFNVNSLIREIQALNDMIREKELEWNNMLYLKKVKEELVVRLTRKKQVMEIMSSRIGEVTDYSITDVQVPLSLGKKATKELQSSIVSNQANCGAVTMMPIMSTSTANSSTGIQNTLKNIVQRRANMNSSELTKAKGSLEKVRRLLISRNILPKPMSGSPSTSTPTSTAVAPSVSATPLVSVSQTYNQIMAQPISNANNLNNQSTASILNTYMQSGGSMAELNGHHQQMQQMGRQGAIKDVKSIIAEHRQQHPETVPRRGRRLKNNWERNVDKSSLLSELSYLLTKNDGNSRPSSADSSHSNSNQLLPNLSGGIQTTSTPNQSANQSFQDALLQFAKLNDHRNSNNAASNLLCSLSVQQSAASKSSASPSTAIGGNTHQQQSQQALYPEVTLHPVSSQQQNINISSELPTSASSTVVSHGGIQMPQGVNNQAHSSSLLHGILTKSQSRPSPAFVSSFSPTLARLLTAPERITTPANNYPSQTTGINLSKSHSEITITPVVHSHQQQNLQQTLMQQRQQDCINLSRGGDNGNVKSEMFMSIDDEADDSADRLVIDESDSGANENSTKVTGQEFHENEVPECQGCKKREAQFVCAGCGNQWYCSRDCQVSAWDEHSEVCTG